MNSIKQNFFLGAVFFLAIACQKNSSTSGDQPAADPTPPSDPLPTYNADAGVLSPQARLRKLSLHLRGITPETGDYAALDDALAAKTQTDFFWSQTQTYLSDSRHTGKMVDRLDELFRVSPSLALPETSFLPNLNGNAIRENQSSMDFLFYKIARDNLSWDELLTHKNYKFLNPQPTNNPFDLIDVTFFSGVKDNLPAAPSPFFPTQQASVAYDLSFDADDPRIAGAVTTARFFGRYNTTNLNKNRGRAAAVFRIFLCDEMHQVVQGAAGDDDNLIDRAFPDPKPAAAEVSAFERMHHKFPVKLDPHGRLPACMACHYKLDPLGRTFLTSGTVLSSAPSPGSLTYRRADGSPVSWNAPGLGALAQQIVLEPDYARCQVTHFWHWFIDGSTPPTENRLQELVTTFNGLGRRTNDFVAHLVNTSDFYRDPEFTVNNLTLTQVKENLQRCDHCHSGLNQNAIPEFTQFPVGGSADSHRRWAKKLVDVLDLPHDGKNRSMPPPSSDWQPSPLEINTIKNWIANGMKDEAGQPTLDSSVGQGWLKP
jgi:hypothetical protein